MTEVARVQTDVADGPADLLASIPDLTDDQISLMLAAAGDRMRARTNTDTNQSIKTIRSTRPVLKLEDRVVEKPLIGFSKSGVPSLDRTRLVDSKTALLANTTKLVEDPAEVKRREVEKKTASAGPMWFGLPKTIVTPEFKREMQLYKMRGVIDSKRHYKKDTSAIMPTYSQVGTIIEGPTEFYSARLTKKERKRTMLDEVLAAEQKTGKLKRKYAEIQTTKRSGKKDYYRSVVEKRAGKFKRK